MLIIAVDDEAAALEALEEAIRTAMPRAELHAFASARAALDFAGRTQVDVAFLDIRMPEIGGLQLGLRLKERHPATNIVFTTGYSQYAGDAFSMHASGYITKPVDAQAVRREIDNLRYHPQEAPAQRVRIQCFGNFAVFVHGRLLQFSRAKPKELLAYLVHKNGVGISAATIASVLWADKVYNRSLRSQVQTVVSQLMATLREAGIADIILREWNDLAIDRDKVSCDYYDLLGGNPQALNAYMGEYLTDYGWAAFAAAQLVEKTNGH